MGGRSGGKGCADCGRYILEAMHGCTSGRAAAASVEGVGQHSTAVDPVSAREAVWEAGGSCEGIYIPAAEDEAMAVAAEAAMEAGRCIRCGRQPC